MYKDENQLDDFFGLKTDKQQELEEKKRRKSLLKRFAGKIRLVPMVLSKKERYLILVFLLLAIGAIIAMPFTAFFHFTKAAPDYGGSFSEGIVGEPRYINPLLAQSNDTDRDMVSLIYSSLMKYNEEGKIIPDLAKSYEISSDGLNYTVYLKENAKWHDGANVTADDVIFTVQTAQNSDYGSLQRINWSGVEIEKKSDYIVIFKLKDKYAQFLNNLTLNILPKYIWQDVKPINFALSEFNLKPVGSGPYKFDKFKKDVTGKIISYNLTANKNFYDGRPHIDNIEIKFYNSEDELINAYNKNEVDNISYVSPENLKKIKFKQRLNTQQLKSPRYFAVFFNQNKSDILSDKNVRLALNYATNKQEIIQKILDDNGTPVDSPMIGDIIDVTVSTKKYDFDLETAKKILNTTGWGNPDANGMLQKKKEKLSLKLTTSTWPELNQVAEILKEQWKQAGVELEIEVLPTTALQQAIKDRDYQMLLFGEILNMDPDPFSLWHSSNKTEWGLNLALYDNKTADTLLEEARQTMNPLERMKKYDDFQKIVIEDAPVVFLYNPFYLYGQSKTIKGFETKIISMPSDRFSNIEKWYIDTNRTWKK